MHLDNWGVRRIFNRFIRLGSTTLLCKELNEQGFRAKRRRGRDARMNDGLTHNGVQPRFCQVYRPFQGSERT